MICQLQRRGNRARKIAVVSAGKKNVVTVFATTHTIPSVGYLVLGSPPQTQRRISRPPPARKIRELAALRRRGDARSGGRPILAYTGDTSPAGLDNYPPAFDAKILITGR